MQYVVCHGLLVWACACNWAYGLDPTQLADAPGPDAPPRCTTDGPPAFSPRVTQAVVQPCHDYTIHEHTAIAACGGPFQLVLGEGPIDAPLRPIDIAPTRAEATLVSPRFTPEGELLVHQQTIDRISIASIYRRDGEAWTWSYDLPFALERFELAGMPSRGPQRHLMVSRTTQFEEAIDDGTGTWTTAVWPATILGVDRLHGPINLSRDGLRAVFVGTSGDTALTRYATRPQIDVPFAGSYVLDVPVASPPDNFLTEDCSRLYFSGLDSIFYAPQR